MAVGLSGCRAVGLSLRSRAARPALSPLSHARLAGRFQPWIAHAGRFSMACQGFAQLVGPGHQRHIHFGLPDACQQQLQAVYIATFEGQALNFIVYAPLAVFQGGEGEAEGMKAGHAQADIGYHQLIAELVVAQHAVGEPGQACMRRRVGQGCGQPGAAGNPAELRRGAVEPTDQHLVIILPPHPDPPRHNRLLKGVGVLNRASAWMPWRASSASTRCSAIYLPPRVEARYRVDSSRAMAGTLGVLSRSPYSRPITTAMPSGKV